MIIILIIMLIIILIFLLIFIIILNCFYCASRFLRIIIDYFILIN